MAVPFRACETPSLRAEFGHPDCALIYTCLAYYYDGLSFEQLQQAFKTLLLLGKNAQKSIYREWFDLCSSQMTFDDQSKLDDVAKIDLTNSVLASQLFQYFKKNMKTINFWLNSCVFPTETAQFPYRLEATAWDLADNSWKQVAGFSGTNDDRLIMPTSLKWVEQTDLSLLATDGKMLQLLQKSKFESLRINDEKMKWKLVLNKVIEKVKSDTTHVTCALIDAGALMAGASNNVQVASYLAQSLDKGVIYFDIARNGWWVRDKLGREWPKHSSPIHERDGFVYFDESRTRGADMKLKQNARAILTLGPEMRKDKLMQAAGRMRMLEHGQMLHLLATENIAVKIKAATGCKELQSSQITPTHVLRWVMTNTVTNIAKWLPEWAHQGGHYYIKENAPELALVPETISLQDLYGHELLEKPLRQVWFEKRNVFAKRWNELIKEPALKRKRRFPEILTVEERIDKQLGEIDSSLLEYGDEYKMKVGSQLEEECERELEVEVEVEQEIEKQLPARNPRAENLWNVQVLQHCSHPQHLYGATQIQSLGSFVESNIRFKGKPVTRINSGVNCFSDGIKWPLNIFGTENFFRAIHGRRHCLNYYLRLIDSFLVFRNGEVLLLSEREADDILKLTWTSNCENFVLVNLTYARKQNLNGSIKFQSPPKVRETSGYSLSYSLFYSLVRPFHVSHQILGALSLFQGLVMFPNKWEKMGVELVVSNNFAKEVAPTFSDMRGLGFTYTRSDLEAICTQ